MVDWWQAVLLLLAGSLMALATSFATHLWTTKANRESEDRQAKRRVEEEQRHEIRQMRRERVQPVVNFLEAAKRNFASQTMGRAIDRAIQNFPPELPKEQAAALLELKEKVTRDSLDTYELGRLLIVAITSSKSIPDLYDKLVTIEAIPQPSTDPEAARKWAPALATAEEMIERYIVSADPSPIRPTGIDSEETVPAPTVEET